MSPLGIGTASPPRAHRDAIRAFYRDLGITLPATALDNVTVRCFVNPDGHRNGDRGASCSVSLRNGAFRCWGCGTVGGAYDAALAKGHTRRSAMDLLIHHSLAERRTDGRPGALRHRDGHDRQTVVRPREPAPAPVHEDPVFDVTEADIDEWAAELQNRPDLIRRLVRAHGWTHTVIRALGLGLHEKTIRRPVRDGADAIVGWESKLDRRVSIPMRDADGRLVGLQRYRPRPRRAEEPKAFNAPGSSHSLIPHPASERGTHRLIAEGPPDAFCARSRGLPAHGLPGVDTWVFEWAWAFAGTHVTIVMDCDGGGRRAAQRIARDLLGIALSVTILDLEPGRDDGYDLSDWLRERDEPVVTLTMLRAATTVVPIEAAT